MSQDTQPPNTFPDNFFSDYPLLFGKLELVEKLQRRGHRPGGDLGYIVAGDPYSAAFLSESRAAALRTGYAAILV